MKFDELLILLPCHSFEDFPLYHEKEAAEGLLSCWTAMWHPALVANAERTPSWARADSPPQLLAGRLLMIPAASETLLQAGWAARAAGEGGHVVRKLHRRSDVLSAALAGLDEPRPEIDPQLAADFLALGYCYLQVELLTRQMRYMSNLDEKHFRAEVVAAAQAAVRGDAEQARRGLNGCFEVLLEARERFYPATSYLIDVTLLAPTTLGQALRDQLAEPVPSNLFLSGETAEILAVREPETLAAVRAMLERHPSALVGGEYREREAPLLPLESLLGELHRGLAAYTTALGHRPTVFGRRRFGLSPVWPQLLVRCGFTGAAHFTLDEGQFPRDGQSKNRWEGIDASALDALTRVPLDAGLPETFLSLPQKIGESMDLDHVAAVAFAHWPGQQSPWYDDLRRIGAYAPVLGKFVTLGDWLTQTDVPGHVTRFTADQYRAPYLKQAVVRKQADPISSLAEHQRRRVACDAQHALHALAALAGGKLGELPLVCADEVERAATEEAGDLDARLSAGLSAALGRFAAALPRAVAAAEQGCLIVNPHSFARRVNVAVRGLETPPAAAGPVKAAEQSGEDVYLSVDVPAFGFVWASGEAPAAAAAKRRSKPEPSLVVDGALRNEFLELRVDPETGGLRSIHDYVRRGNRMSQQLAFRSPGPRPKPGDIWRDPDELAQYTRMAADSVDVTAAGGVLGEITSRGRLLDADDRVRARYVQRAQVWRGSPVAVLEIELSDVEEPRSDAWNSYYAARFAWADEAAGIRRSVGQGAVATDAKRLEAPHFVEIAGEQQTTAILTGGLPYHRRIGLRMLDTLLVVRGERCRRFRLGIGIDLAYPLPHALDLLTPPTALVERAAPPSSGTSGWLCHVDLKNVVATHLSPLVSEGRLVGFRARLLETRGRAGKARLRAFRPLTHARHVDFLGQTLAQLPLDDGAATIDFTAHEWVEVEARWTNG